MPYGTIKVDTITFTSGSSDVSVAISGLVQNPTFSGDVTVTGTVSGTVVRGNTVSGATVTGTAGQFGTLTGNTAGFTTVTGATVTGTAANFVTVSGTTVTGNVGNFTTITGGSAGFTTVTGTTITGTTLTVASGTFTGNSTAAAFIPTGSTVPTNGIYLPSANNVAISTNGSGRLFVDSTGKVGIGSSTPFGILTTVSTGIDLSSTTVSLGTDGANGCIVSDATSTNNTGVGYWFRHGGLKAGIASSRTNTGNWGTDLRFYTHPVATTDVNNVYERMRIDPAGNVGIGSTAPNSPLDVVGTSRSIQFGSATRKLYAWSDSGGVSLLTGDSQTGTGFYIDEAGPSVRIWTGTTERARIDSSGRLLVGTSTARDKFFNAASGENPLVQFEGAGVTAQGLYMLSLTANNTSSNSAAGANLILARSRGTAVGSYTVVTDGDCLGRVSFQGADGSELVEGASISALADGGVGANDLPTRLVFSTTADGASSPTERMSILNTGVVRINVHPSGLTSGGAEIHSSGYIYTNVNAGAAAYFNRIANDGTVVEIRQDNVAEGTISVSGTTVSYNGAHLSRWSQLPGAAERTEILRGTVLSNLDEMCEWGEEDNEQLNRMKVSDVEGDKNVSGVFQAWDDDDDTYTNDFYCAMTGDFIIRIAAGVTIERGDLLMSAGDGTAKPQGDGYVQDKTIAKVTSTNVSCTYDDGSYCVPCVLMAC